MKKYIFPVFVAIIAATTIIGCESSATKVSNAEQDVIDAQIKLDQARQDSIADYEKTQAAWDVQIAKNELAIAEYKNKIAKIKKEQRETDEAKLAEMEERNAAMKANVKNYNESENVGWSLFKADIKATFDKFDEEMTELGESIEAKLQPNKK